MVLRCFEKAFLDWCCGRSAIRIASKGPFAWRADTIAEKTARLALTQCEISGKVRWRCDELSRRAVFIPKEGS